MSNRITKGEALFEKVTTTTLDVNSTATFAAINTTGDLAGVTLSISSSGEIPSLNVATTATIASLSAPTLATTGTATIQTLDVNSTATFAACNTTGTATATALSVTSTGTIADLSAPLLATTGTATIQILDVNSTATIAELNTTGALSIAGVALTATPTEINTVADISVNLAIPKVKVISVTHNGATTETDTSWDLPAVALVSDVAVKVNTAATAASTLSVGLLASSSGGDADGFLAGVSTTGTGVKLGVVTASTQLASTTRGVLLMDYSIGTTSTGDSGYAVPKWFASDAVTAKSITYTSNSTGTTLDFNIIVSYVEYTT